MRYFDDLEVGNKAESAATEMTEAEIINFASLYDPESFHTNPQLAKKSFFGGLIASGVHTFALFRRLDYELNHDIAAICGVEWSSVCFPKPVYPGDFLRAQTTITSKRESKSKPGRGLVTTGGAMINQDNDLVMSASIVTLVRCQPE